MSGFIDVCVDVLVACFCLSGSSLMLLLVAKMWIEFIDHRRKDGGE